MQNLISAALDAAERINHLTVFRCWLFVVRDGVRLSLFGADEQPFFRSGTDQSPLPFFDGR